MLHIFHSNRLEALLGGLVQTTAPTPADPFTPEVIVVQNAGMARWLAQQLALANGVAANLAFPLPASFFWRMCRAWQPDLPAETGYERETLTWRIYTLLPQCLADPAFAELDRYLAGEPRDLKRWQLAVRIADVFDQYLVYRPDLVLAWEAGTEDHWQARLWRALASDAGASQPAGQLIGQRAHLLAWMEQARRQGRPPAAPDLLPARVSLFGLTALAPAWCGPLGMPAEHREVHLFVHNPCRQYWADIEDDRGQSRRRAKALRHGEPDPGALLDLGNPLLAAFGHTGQAFLDQVLELRGRDEEWFVTPAAGPAGDCLLTQLQTGVLELTDPRRRDLQDRQRLDPRDDSLLVHRCHGPLREVQVLHDRLLALIAAADARGEPLEPRDILVMAPDIDLYAPFVDAVFGAAPPERALPWSIADRTLAGEAPALAAFAELLALPLSRLTAAEVLAWLQVPAIARRHGLNDEDLGRIRAWIDGTGICWGLDAAMRDSLGLPAEPANTWAFGLERLFLGLTLPAPGFEAAGAAPAAASVTANLFRQRLPWSDLSPSDAELLGVLQGFIDSLGRWRAELAQARPAAAWRATLLALLAELFAPDDEEEALFARVRDALDGLERSAAAAGLSEALPPDLLRALLAGVLAEGGGGARFLSGRVTFCNMVPMRSIPARVIALLGLNGTDFPRRQPRPGFDLMALQPRRGDRSRRADDRYLFLEALLSAREHLHLSWCGRDPRDNSLRVPAVVLDELLAVIDAGWCAEDADGKLVAPSTRLVVDHPLQPFSPRAFDPAAPARWSHAAEWLPLAGDGAAPVAGAAEPRFAVPLPAPVVVPATDGLEPLEVDELAAFLRHPARWFLTSRLRLHLPREAAASADSEPFVLDGLAGWQVRQQLFEWSMAGVDEADSLALARATGQLPHGAAGLLDWRAQSGRVTAFRSAWQAAAATPRPRQEVDLPLPGPRVRLTGWLDGLTAEGLCDYRLGRRRGGDLLGFWLRHLLLNALAPADCGRRGALLHEADDRPCWTRLAPVVQPLPLLADLVALLLQARRAPVPLYPDCALKFAETENLDQVRKVWAGGFKGPAGEGEDPAVALVTRGLADPLGADFQQLALRVFRPLLAVLEEGEGW